MVLLILAGHLPWLPASLEDLDSFNFALGLDDFDPRKHQPHPPGYPVIIGLAHVATPLALATGVLPGPAAHARALSLVSALSGALAVVPLFLLYRRLNGLGLQASDRWRPSRASGPEPVEGRVDAVALCGVVLALTAPIFWFTMSRPMSDVPGLLLALSAQALLAGAWVEQRARVGQGDRLLLAGAALSALAIGARSQALWLVAPIFTLAVVARRGQGSVGARLKALAVFGVVCVAWGVPLLAASGGIAGYLATLSDQAGEDFAGVEMVWTTPSARVVVLALRYALLDVWGPLPVGVLVVLAAITGVMALLRRAGTALLIAGVLWVPYFVFHLLFQETATSRYDLPLVPAWTWLAVQGLQVGPRVVLPVAVVLFAVSSLWVTAPALKRYGLDGSPIGRAMSALVAAAPTPDLASHHVLLRAFQADPRVGVPWTSRGGREWLEVTRHWREALARGDVPGRLWFLADPQRIDAAVVDPASRTVRGRYDWTFDAPRFLRGTRPDAVVWHEVGGAPGWFAGEGWALSPELAGVASRDGAGLSRGALRADIRSRASAATMVIGGRHLGGAGDGPVRLEARLGEAVAETWDVAPGPFVRVVRLPEGRLDGSGYTPLTLAAVGATGASDVPVAIEQFDVQSEGVPVLAFDTGWHEHEYDRRTRRAFRWTSGTARLRVVGARRDVELLVEGESPIRYFGRAPAVVIRVGSTVVGTYAPDRDFAWRVVLPHQALIEGDGVVTIATDATFQPSATGAADARHLGLRTFGVTIAR